MLPAWYERDAHGKLVLTLTSSQREWIVQLAAGDDDVDGVEFARDTEIAPHGHDQRRAVTLCSAAEGGGEEGSQ
jgi:hypothetical protein